MSRAETSSRRPTLFAPGVSGRAAGEVLSLDAVESRHVRALRLAPGARVRLTDGSGASWYGRLRDSGGRQADCVLDERDFPPDPLPVEIAFGVGNKAHVMWLVEKATEMGVRRLVPFESERTRSVADGGRSPAFWSKAERRAVAALKQSGGAWLPEIRPVCDLDDYLAQRADPGRREADSVSWLVRLDAAGEALRCVLDAWDGGGGVAMLVGPEGGWSPGEVSRLDSAGFRRASLGALVLRFETAAVAALAVVAQQVMARAAAGEGHA